jgi:hypothetical protein
MAINSLMRASAALRGSADVVIVDLVFYSNLPEFCTSING